MKRDIVCLGELIADFLPMGRNKDGFSLYVANPGGAPSNVAAAVAAYGGSAAIIGKVGRDTLGMQLGTQLAERGVNTDGLVYDAQYKTALALVMLDEWGERSFRLLGQSPADLMLRAEELALPILRSCRIFHFGARSLSSKISQHATLAAIAEARKSGARISFDPNVRADLWASEKQAIEDCQQGIELADYIKLSLEEMKLILSTEDIEKVVRTFAAQGKTCIVTDGSNGAFAWLENELFHLPAYPVTPADTTGAGDAFWAAWLYASLLPQMTGKRQLRLASAAGALATLKKGAMTALPAWREAEELAG